MTVKISGQLLPEIKLIREQVFMEEQGFKAEFDETDEDCLHLLIEEEGKPVAVGRMYGGNGEYHIGRIAVVKDCRKGGYGRMAVEALEKKAIELGGKKTVLSAQCQARGFYEKMGYTATGEEYLDEHCPHIDMYKILERE